MFVFYKGDKKKVFNFFLFFIVLFFYCFVFFIVLFFYCFFCSIVRGINLLNDGV